MKKYKIVEIIQKQEKLESVVCDRCKKECDVEDDILELQEFLHIKFVGGYKSVFGDMNIVEADICQRCLKAILGDVLRINQFEGYSE